MLKKILLLSIVVMWMQGLYLALVVFSKFLGLDVAFILHDSKFYKFADSAFAPLMTMVYLCVLSWITIFQKVKHEHLLICFLICAFGWLSNLFLDSPVFEIWPFLLTIAILKFRDNNKIYDEIKNQNS